jgi:hypothetical protein
MISFAYNCYRFYLVDRGGLLVVRTINIVIVERIIARTINSAVIGGAVARTINIVIVGRIVARTINSVVIGGVVARTINVVIVGRIIAKLL